MFRSRRIRNRARCVYSAAEQLQGLTISELRAQVASLREAVDAGRELRDIRHQADPLVFEAIRRATGQLAYAVQLYAAEELAGNCIVEMRTGEGKTLAALFPVFLRALAGLGVHVVTANDYLADRDAAFARSVLEPLGLAVASVQAGMSSDERRKAYEADVTYGTVREFGFDYLRDCLRRNESHGQAHQIEGDVQRGHFAAIVDEADSVLLDEARTPLLIALEDEAATPQRLYQWCDTVAGRMEASEYSFDSIARRVQLTQSGYHRVTSLPRPGVLAGCSPQELARQVEFSLMARLGLKRDRDYVITDGRVQIVDESTGRVMTGRRWHEPLQHAIEAREKLQGSGSTEAAARITVQSYFSRYQQLAGMSGTAMAAAAEFRATYGLRVRQIPPRLPCRRQQYRPLAFASRSAKHAAIAGEVRSVLDAGRAVLIGTPSVGASEDMQQVLASQGFEATVLNCHHHTEEAGIVAEAGQPGRVTIATNMAGRGTDIPVHPSVVQRGGLHVIGTEFHSSSRIDEQLTGRTARQGEDGSCRFLVSLDDELLSRLPEPERLHLRKSARPDAAGMLDARWIGRMRRVQLQIERAQRRMRRDLLRHEQQQQRQFGRLGLDPVLWAPG